MMSTIYDFSATAIDGSDAGPMAGLMAKMGGIEMQTMVESIETTALADDLFAPFAGQAFERRSALGFVDLGPAVVDEDGEGRARTAYEVEEGASLLQVRGQIVDVDDRHPRLFRAPLQLREAACGGQGVLE